jgi:CRISPR/Cas system CSM-associated protein Csm3 (group 7 of RAMP superfamily)
MEGLRSDIDEDPLLQFLAQDKPLVRQRVRLNGKGTATDMGKFDTTHIPTGVRYSCFISLWSDGSAAQDAGVERLLGLLQLPDFRIGHGTRGGQGAFKTQAIHSARWDLRTTEGRNSYCARPRQRADVGNLQATNLPAPATNSLTVTLELTAEAGWRIGGGEQAFSQADANGRTPDLLPQSETTIHWDAKQNASLLQQQAVVPASAIKGALSHRTAYHYSCLTSSFADEDTEDNHLECPAVRFLFGHATGDDTDEAGAAGRIIINDLYLSAPKSTRQMHNRIDQFTGGVITGALFEEELLWQTPLTLQVHLLEPASTPTLVRQAFALTLNDLTLGWLPLGAGGSRGQGCFFGELMWSDPTWPTAQQELV